MSFYIRHSIASIPASELPAAHGVLSDVWSSCSAVFWCSSSSRLSSRLLTHCVLTLLLAPCRFSSRLALPSPGTSAADAAGSIDSAGGSSGARSAAASSRSSRGQPPDKPYVPIWERLLPPSAPAEERKAAAATHRVFAPVALKTFSPTLGSLGSSLVQQGAAIACWLVLWLVVMTCGDKIPTHLGHVHCPGRCACSRTHDWAPPPHSAPLTHSSMALSCASWRLLIELHPMSYMQSLGACQMRQLL